MKTLFGKKKKEFLILILSVVLLLNVSSIEVDAAGNVLEREYEIEHLNISDSPRMTNKVIEEMNAKALLYNCTINVYSSSSGLQVTIVTDCAQRASIIGVKDVKIKQKVWYGWKTVATSSGGYSTDAMGYMGTILYTNAIKNETYRISCVHYADADIYTELENEIDVVFTY